MVAERHQKEVPFGTILTTNYGGIKRWVIESANDIVLPIGQTYAFDEDAGTRWPHLFPPGHLALRVIRG